eukprot:TRINITY_DN28884_c0_g1_i1.p1 TRINITY_DN28884_c0_g1~~TRINITY_DN28884_c0_g1_i1.p1  ORF type:complete len:874 (-),score=161.01 TRINITY_DN28884_c0_g1_i1:90-2711(-)
MGNIPICSCATVPEGDESVQQSVSDEQQEVNELPSRIESTAAIPAVVKRKQKRTMGRSNSLTFTRGDLELSYRPPSQKNAEEKRKLAESLRGNPKLRRLANFGEPQIDLLVATAHKEIFEKGEVLMTEGELDNKIFYVTASGTVQISSSEPFKVVRRKDGHADLAPSEDKTLETKKNCKLDGSVMHISTEAVGAWCSLGASTMVNCTPRKTTIIALERCEVWVFSEASVKIVAEQAQEAASIRKSPENTKLISEVLEANGNFQGLIPLRSRHVEKLAQIAHKEEVAQGEVIMREGDLNADAFYIVGDGLLEFTSSQPFEVISSRGKFHLTRGEGSAQTTRECGKGLSFGEISMLYCAPRFATVVAKTNTVLWAIARSDFQVIQKQAVEEHIKGRIRTLEKLSVLSSFSTRDKERFAALLEKVNFKEGEFIYREGDLGTALYIVYEGSVAVTATGKADDSFHAKPTPGSYDYRYFGESALLDTTATKRTESVQVTSAKASALVLESEELHKIWDRLIEEPASAFERHKTGVVKEKHQEQTALSVDNLDTLGLLGCGALGPVQLVKHKKTSTLYALKQMSRGLIVQRGLRNSVAQERTLWMEVLSPFIVRVFATFKLQQSLCFLLEPALGGCLAAAYPKHQLYGSVKHVRYHAAGVILGLEHLHKRSIVYRNIKPASVVLSEHGHPRLTDMSLAKMVYGHTFTACGTPEYLPPEVISAVGHTRAADWWSLGVLIFELMTGSSPFQADQPMGTYLKVMRGMDGVNMPEVCNGSTGSLIIDLCRQVPIDRLAMRRGGIENVFGHAWFDGFDWKAMRSLALTPPYVPSFPLSDGKLVLSELSTECLLSHFSASSGDLPRPVDVEDEFDSDWDEEFAFS